MPKTFTPFIWKIEIPFLRHIAILLFFLIGDIMKQIYKAGGPYKTQDGKEYDAKNIHGSEKAPNGWNTDLSKALAKAKKPAQETQATQQEIATES